MRYVAWFDDYVRGEEKHRMFYLTLYTEASKHALRYELTPWDIPELAHAAYERKFWDGLAVIDMIAWRYCESRGWIPWRSWSGQYQLRL
jgi:hypothetical protein